MTAVRRLYLMSAAHAMGTNPHSAQVRTADYKPSRNSTGTVQQQNTPVLQGEPQPTLVRFNLHSPNWLWTPEKTRQATNGKAMVLCRSVDKAQPENGMELLIWSQNREGTKSAFFPGVSWRVKLYEGSKTSLRESSNFCRWKLINLVNKMPNVQKNQENAGEAITSLHCNVGVGKPNGSPFVWQGKKAQGHKKRLAAGRIK